MLSDDELFANVGNKFGFRATTARNLYYEHLDLIRSRVWETVNELLEKGRGLDESFDEVSKRIAAVSASFARDLYYQVRLRATGQKDGKDLSLGLPRSSDRGCPLQDPHGSH
jgi:hypothetical protein